MSGGADERHLFAFALLYLWGALALDTVIAVLAWAQPDLWFRSFHNTGPATVMEVALLRRSAGQWAAFAAAQALTLALWPRRPEWLAIAAGVRFSDLATDLSYILAAPAMTRLGWACLMPPAPLNLIGFLVLLRCYGAAVKVRASGEGTV